MEGLIAFVTVCIICFIVRLVRSNLVLILNSQGLKISNKEIFSLFL